MINLTKKFDKFEAVRGLTFGVRNNECFGLLGVNGAGKTTTFRWEIMVELRGGRVVTTICRMITGDEVLTSGQSFIGTISLSHHRAQYLQSIGYCPQFDSIIEVRRSSGGINLAADCDTTPQVLTGREMLTLFARIRGLRTAGGVIRREIEKLAEFVDLTEYLDRQSGLYSGGRH